MFIGPVFNREVVTSPRRKLLYITRSLYVAGLFGLMLTAWLVLIGTQEVRNIGDFARFGASVFQLLAIVQLTLGIFFSALLTAAAVSQEKDRRTLILLLLTNLTNSELVLGKLLAAMLNVLSLLAAALPFFMLTVLFGGVSFDQIARVFAVTLLSMLAAGSLGSMIALWREKTFQTLAMTTLLLVFWLIVWEIIAALGGSDSMYATLATVFSPMQAVIAATLPSIATDSSMGWLGNPIHGFLLFALSVTVLLNVTSILMVRVWNPSRDLRKQTSVPEQQESIWGAEHDVASEGATPVVTGNEPIEGFISGRRILISEEFTDRARKVMQLANQEAQRFNHEYIGTEHILLGLIKEGSGVAANVLKNLDVDLRKIRLEVEKVLASGPDPVTMGKLPQTPRAKKVIEYSMEEARNLNHNYVGTEHILLGLLREQEGVAAQVLMNLGLRLEDVREEVLNLLGHGLESGEVPERSGTERGEERKSGTSPAEPAKPSVHAAPGKTRTVWDNPILWREIRTWAYGRKVLLIRVAYWLLFAMAAASMVSLVQSDESLRSGRGITLSAADMSMVVLLLLSLVLVNALAVTSITTERDLQALDLLLVTDITPKEFIFGKLGGVFYNTKEMVVLPMLLCIYLWFSGYLSGENLIFLIGGLIVVNAFVAMLGIHVGMAYDNSRNAIIISLGTLFFLFLGTATCMWIMISFKGSFGVQLLTFAPFMLGGGVGLYVALGSRNPSMAIGAASFLCPVATFYAITSFLLDSPLAVFSVISLTYSFATLAMLVPAIFEFDMATGRTTEG